MLVPPWKLPRLSLLSRLELATGPARATTSGRSSRRATSSAPRPATRSGEAFVTPDLPALRAAVEQLVLEIRLLLALARGEGGEATALVGLSLRRPGRGAGRHRAGGAGPVRCRRPAGRPPRGPGRHAHRPALPGAGLARRRPGAGVVRARAHARPVPPGASPGPRAAGAGGGGQRRRDRPARPGGEPGANAGAPSCGSTRAATSRCCSCAGPCGGTWGGSWPEGYFWAPDAQPSRSLRSSSKNAAGTTPPRTTGVGLLHGRAPGGGVAGHDLEPLLLHRGDRVLVEPLAPRRRPCSPSSWAMASSLGRRSAGTFSQASLRTSVAPTMYAQAVSIMSGARSKSRVVRCRAARWGRSRSSRSAATGRCRLEERTTGFRPAGAVGLDALGVAVPGPDLGVGHVGRAPVGLVAEEVDGADGAPLDGHVPALLRAPARAAAAPSGRRTASAPRPGT